MSNNATIFYDKRLIEFLFYIIRYLILNLLKSWVCHYCYDKFMHNLLLWSMNYILFKKFKNKLPKYKFIRNL